MEYNSPVDEAFESAPIFREAIAKVLRGESVDSEQFQSLAQQYNKQICGGEYWHKATTETLFSHRLASMGPGMRTYITKARCPVTKLLITERKVIGEDIPEPEYINVIEGPDLLLSESYPPTCEPCSAALRVPRTHPTILGFTRYIAQSKRHLFRALHEANAAYHNMEGMHEYGGMHLVKDLKDEIQALHDECEDRIATAQLEFRDKVFSAPSDIFVETRIKGHERLRDKLKRRIANAYTGKPITQLKDVYGTRFIGATREDVEAIMFDLKEEIIQMHGADTLIPVPPPVENDDAVPYKGDKYIAVKEKDTHHSLRLTVRFGPEHLRSRLSLHGMSLNDWFLDQDTHVTHEETKRAELATLVALHPEVKRACKTIDDIFDQLGRLS